MAIFFSTSSRRLRPFLNSSISFINFLLSYPFSRIIIFSFSAVSPFYFLPPFLRRQICLQPPSVDSRAAFIPHFFLFFFLSTFPFSFNVFTLKGAGVNGESAFRNVHVHPRNGIRYLHRNVASFAFWKNKNPVLIANGEERGFLGRVRAFFSHRALIKRQRTLNDFNNVTTISLCP